MPAFAVLEPPGHLRGAGELTDRFVFLREKFSLGAFLLGPLWAIWRGLWVVLIVYLVVAGFVGYGLRAAGIGWFEVVGIFGLVQLLFGLEATNLHRWTCVRNGWRDCGVVIADDLDLAERRFFDSRSMRRSAAFSAPISAPVQLPLGQIGMSPPDVVGLFPEPGGGR